MFNARMRRFAERQGFAGIGNHTAGDGHLSRQRRPVRTYASTGNAFPNIGLPLLD